MKIGTVTDRLQAVKTAPGLGFRPFLTVDTREGVIVAADHAGAQVGDKVLLITGDAAARFSMETPADAAVVAILEQEKK